MILGGNNSTIVLVNEWNHWQSGWVRALYLVTLVAMAATCLGIIAWPLIRRWMRGQVPLLRVCAGE
ncbi:hypothetical protein CRD60_01125 [Bifidobacterium aemilianum]|uniref:Uncharacterized protein n=1 Tax=Bifidobacterium aemilianum TaxID=2493120 RepID=A0A366KAV9_9BIFI|nr:hypothetical protein [Bifidobacterium aemilianum]RBP98497.1 hypothetical protein CRD60_01125 [Bifidobacterium aemilianum]